MESRRNRLENHSWKYLSLIGDETINLQRTKVYVFSDSVLCLGKVHQHPESNEAWKKRIEWIINEKSYRDPDWINGELTEFEWYIFPGFTTLQLCDKITDLLSILGEEPETFIGRILLWRCSTTFLVTVKAMNSKAVSILANNCGIGQWSFMEENRPQGIWDHIADKMLLEFSESGRPIFLPTTLLSRGQLRSKEHGKLSIHYCAEQATIETISRTIVSASQLILYVTVANMCEEYESLHKRKERPVVVGQSSSSPKGWIQGNSKIWPVVEVANSYLPGQCGVKIAIWSLNRAHSHFCVWISHVSSRFMMSLNNNETEIPEVQLRSICVKTDLSTWRSEICSRCWSAS